MELVEFFKTAREREIIRQKRFCGEPWPWTDDPIFQRWRFCNVHREKDKTTEWFRENVRNYFGGWLAVQACFIFRWFNRIDVGKRIEDLFSDNWLTNENVQKEAYQRLKNVKPIVTGAYMMKTPDGLSKCDGVFWAIDHSLEQLKKYWSKWSGESLKEAWEDLCELPFLGPFMAYEIVTDLRWTPVLNKANDIMTWANPGPGAIRGLRDVTRNFTLTKADHDEMLEVMRKILAESRHSYNWPIHYSPWEMREVEHWLCEYHKYQNAKQGKRLKRRFHE